MAAPEPEAILATAPCLRRPTLPEAGLWSSLECNMVH